MTSRGGKRRPPIPAKSWPASWRQLHSNKKVEVLVLWKRLRYLLVTLYMANNSLGTFYGYLASLEPGDVDAARFYKSVITRMRHVQTTCPPLVARLKRRIVSIWPEADPAILDELLDRYPVRAPRPRLLLRHKKKWKLLVRYD